MRRWIQAMTLAAVVMMTAGLHKVVAGEEPLPNCPVTGEPIDFSVSTSTADGPVYFCCKHCIKKFQKNAAKFASAVAKQRQALATREKIQVTCPITGEEVSAKIFTEQNGKKIHFCCKRCVKKFTSDPGKYKAALLASYTYQTKCPVTGETIDPASFSVLPDGKKVFYCCKDCAKKLLADPAKYAPKLASQGTLIDVAKIKEAFTAHGGQEHGQKAHDHGGD